MQNPIIQELIDTDQAIRPLETTARLYRRAAFWLAVSVALHLTAAVAIKYSSLFAMAVGLRNIEFVEESYDRTILLDAKKLKYPAGYFTFTAPQKITDLEKLKKEEERRRRLEEERRQRELARQKKAEEKRRDDAKGKNGEVAGKSQRDSEKELAKKTEPETKPAPSPKPKTAPFGRINTLPIREQVEVLYQAKKAGKLVFNENKLIIGVTGKIKADGSLSDCRVYRSSGNPQIDQAAMAILRAVSESRALGPLSQLTSMSMLLEVDQHASLRVTGFASSEQIAMELKQLADAALLLGKVAKSNDPSAMMMLNNLRLQQVGPRLEALISLPRQTAAETLSRAMEKEKI
jgi:outer membrane biosynthesis protein TonB